MLLLHRMSQEMAHSANSHFDCFWSEADIERLQRASILQFDPAQQP
jgi:hypothetical protein